MHKTYYENQSVTLYKGDCIRVLSTFPENSIDMIFADPPYLLSNDGITCHAGRMVSVNKGEWDRSKGIEADHRFTKRWLKACHRVLIWLANIRKAPVRNPPVATNLLDPYLSTQIPINGEAIAERTTPSDIAIAKSPLDHRRSLNMA